MTDATPSSILIIGSGVFGLSTAYSLAKNPAYKNTKITLVDRQSFPAGDSSSVHFTTNKTACASSPSAPTHAIG